MDKKYDINKLLEITETLRGENGCVWDKEQDHQSIKRNFIEETYEAVEAIENGNLDLLKEELGDVLFQVVFHCQIEKELGNFDFTDVCDNVTNKLIYRHPHVFADTTVANSDEVLTNWDALKKVEKGQKSDYDVMKSVSIALPALIRAEKLQSKAKKMDKEYKADESLKADDIGKLLFDIVALARKEGIDPEQALTDYNNKFVESFKE